MIRFLMRRWADPQLVADNNELKARIAFRDTQIGALTTQLRETNSDIAKASRASTVFVQRILELEDDLAHERDENRRLRVQLANALNAPWPTALTGTRAVLTPAQRQDAADDAAWKRAQDGLGDPQ